MRSYGPLLEADQYVVRGDIPVEGDGLQRHEDTRQLLQQVAHDCASSGHRRRPLLASWKRPFNKMGNLHRLVLLVADAVEPLVQGPAAYVRHRQAHEARPGAVARLHGAVGDVARHVRRRVAAARRHDLHQLGLKGRGGERCGVLRADHLHGDVLGGAVLRGLPDDAKGATANDLKELEGPIPDLHPVPAPLASGGPRAAQCLLSARIMQLPEVRRHDYK
mmetsp:Transcript_96043/g.277347  ORF Transcript_96043/g.277347 Transcript_96043/m.277347 type:complete len:220 (+) Transcript_96043:1088-1747(+)